MKYCSFLCSLFIALQSSAQWKVEVKNPSKFERKEEIVELSRSGFEKYFKKKIDKQDFVVKVGNKEVVSQKVDLDGDGNWDVFVFLDDFKPNQKKTFEISLGKSRLSNIESLAHARMKPKLEDDSFGPSVSNAEMPLHNPPTNFSKNPLPPYLTEGPALENDKNAFRLYFDTRNTKDIYGKRQPRLVMDSVGSNTKHSYHNLADWGMDILHVEKSLGAGSLAVFTKDANGKDTLLRLGGKEVLKETYTLLNDGPLFASFKMDYVWNVLGRTVNISETMNIWKGQYFYESKVDQSGGLAGDVLVTGIADFYENKMDSIKNKIVTTLYSYGKQSENKDELGMAIMTKTKGVAFLKQAPKANSEITKTHLLGQWIKSDEVNEFRFYSCWIKTDENIAGSEASFRNFLQKEMDKYAQPMQLFY